MDEEALFSSLDLQGLIWPHEKEKDEIFLQQGQQILASDHLPPLPLITNTLNFSSSDEGACNPLELGGEAAVRAKEMIYRAAALRPVSVGVEETAERPRRRNSRISSDPQTAAARRRRERIGERLRALQRLVPGGRKMDTASMLDEAANYLKFLKAQVTAMEKSGHGSGLINCCGGMIPFPVNMSHCSSSIQTCIFPFTRQ